MSLAHRRFPEGGTGFAIPLESTSKALVNVWRGRNETDLYRLLFLSSLEADFYSAIGVVTSMRNEKGFTLIELLVVIAIIGILAAIAIPQFAEYKIRAFNSRAQSDLRNGLTAQEAYFVDEENYLDCDGTSCEDLPGFVLSDDVELDFNVSTTGDNFAGASCHPRGDKTYDWVSSGTDAGIVQSRDTGVGACTGLPTVPTI